MWPQEGGYAAQEGSLLCCRLQGIQPVTVHRKLCTCTACCSADNGASLRAAWLFAGCDLCKQNRDRQSPLFLASQKGNEEIVVHLLAALPRPLVFTTLSAIPVHAAAKQGHAHILQLLAEGGCDINQVSTVGCQVSTGGCLVSTVGCPVSTVACQVSTVGRRVSTVGCRVSTVACQVNTVGCHVSIVGCQVNTVGCQVSTVACQVSTVGCHVSTVGCRVNTMRCQVSTEMSGEHCGMSSEHCGQVSTVACQLSTGMTVR